MNYIEIQKGIYLKEGAAYSFYKGAAHLTGTLQGEDQNSLVFTDVHQRHAYISSGAWLSPDSALEIPEAHISLLLLKKREISDIIGL